MAKTTAREYTAAAHALAKLARQRSIPYVLGGMSLKGMDCQGLCEYLLTECGIGKKECNLAGSNAHYRACRWTGTFDECRAAYGEIPQGAWLFILKQDGREPARYHGDGVGNASHVGVYLGDGQALQSSASRGGVVTTAFDGNARSGSWNRVGLPRWIDYGTTDTLPVSPEPEEVPAGDTAAMATVSTPDGNPVKLRALPGRHCGLYWKVPNGEAVAVEGFVQSGGVMWAKASYGGREGYIMSEFLIGG